MGAGREVKDPPDASIVLKVHVLLAASAQARRNVFADVTGRGGEDVYVICVNLISHRCSAMLGSEDPWQTKR